MSTPKGWSSGGQGRSTVRCTVSASPDEAARISALAGDMSPGRFLLGAGLALDSGADSAWEQVARAIPVSVLRKVLGEAAP